MPQQGATTTTSHNLLTASSTASAAPAVPYDWRKLAHAWEYPEPIPNFELTAHTGKTFRLAALSDSFVLVGFIFTSCSVPKACPLTMDKMQKVQLQWAERSGIKGTKGRKLSLLTLTFDPENDTPKVLKAYAEHRRIDFDNWTLATGPDGLMEDALPSLFGVLALPAGKGAIAHNVKVALLAPGLKSIKEWEDNRFEPSDVIEQVLSYPLD